MNKFSKILVCILGMALVLSLAGCGNPDGEGANVVKTGSGGAETQEAEAPKQGTRENPLPVGSTAKIGSWEVTLNSVNLDATAAIKKANEFNEAPPAGSKYVMANITAKYIGEESGTFWADMSYKFYGSGGNTFDTASVVVDKSIADAGETFPDASVTGNLAFQVPADQLEGGAIILEESFTSESRTFFAVK